MLRFIFGIAAGTAIVVGTKMGVNFGTELMDGNIFGKIVGGIIGGAVTSQSLDVFTQAIDKSPSGEQKNQYGTGGMVGLAIGAVMWYSGAFAQDIDFQTPAPKAPIIDTIKLRP